MPTAQPWSELSEAVAGLNTLASADLASLWQQVTNAAEAEIALRDILPALIDTYGLAAGTLAADWYDDQRDKVGAKKAFRAIPADIKDTGAQSLIGWATAKANGFSEFQTLIEGGAQRRIANFSRLTVAGSSIADPSARGWYRVGSGSSCEFCSLLIDRGAVYTEATADFASHDHCNCGAAPSWDDKAVVEVRAFEPSSRNITDADRARVRAYIKANPNKG